jgi:hypothetical protein
LRGHGDNPNAGRVKSALHQSGGTFYGAGPRRAQYQKV